MPGKPYLLQIGSAIILSSVLGHQASADSTERVSVGSAGTEATGDSFIPAISADGRYVTFQSDAANLVPGDTNGVRDVFVHDRQSGATTRVSVDSAGAQATGLSNKHAISADGRFVAFDSEATDLVTGDTNGVYDIFVHDRQSGSTERVSVTSAGAQATGPSNAPSISADGRYVTFESLADDLVAGDTNATVDVFVHDRQSGATERVSVDSAGTEATGINSTSSIGADGRFAAFHSVAANLVAGDTNGTRDVFVHDRQNGTTERVNVDSAGAQANDYSDRPSISADGRFVAFYSDASNLVGGDTNGLGDVFVHDRQSGTTERVSVDSDGAQATGGDSFTPSISADARFVAFYSDADNLIGGDTNASTDVFVHDRQSGATERVSVDSVGAEATDGGSFSPSISAGGRFVAFRSSATTLVADDIGGLLDIFVRDRGLLPDGRNDFLADFGAAGTWQRLNGTTWQKIHDASSTMMIVGDIDGSLRDEEIVGFNGAGL